MRVLYDRSWLVSSRAIPDTGGGSESLFLVKP